jgi:hypothetical protein
VDNIRKEEMKVNPLLKWRKYLLLSNRENLNDKQSEKFEAIRLAGLNIKPMKELLIRETYQEIYLPKTPRICE